jgi:phosphoribosylformimino-5-aminoimidazole carboxamide ribotide isomerase
MHVWPAIDLRGGRCVRLVQGDFARETVFGDDPVAMARRWQADGADRLHLVDLDGARTGRAANLEAIAAILAATGLPCQVGGGVRDEAAIEALLQAGAARVVVGTRAIRDPAWFLAQVRAHPGRLCLGLDARDGLVAAEGWEQGSTVTAVELARRFEGEPLAAVIATDIAVDGTLAGPSYATLAELQRAVKLPIVASGGIASAADVARLAATGVSGCILGRALYENRLTVAEAIAAAARPAGSAPAAC